MRVKILFLLGLLATAALAVDIASSRAAQVGISKRSRHSRTETPENRLVIRVIDGDTIVVSPNEKVRLIG